MYPVRTFITLSFFCILLAASTPMSDKDSAMLELVHVLFRNGDVTNLQTPYPNDPHINESYAPYGFGELTKKGKTRVFRLGKALRDRYDKFLGSRYKSEIVEAISSDTHQSKESLLIVLAKLFPISREDVWEEGLNWQPIPYTHAPRTNDTLFFGRNCPKYRQAYERHVQSTLLSDDFVKERSALNSLSKQTGWKVSSFEKINSLYKYLRCQEEWGLELPAWTRQVYPRKLEELVKREFAIETATDEMKTILSGHLVKKVVEDSRKKVEGLFARKLILYSGHDFNIAHFLSMLDAFKDRIPPYGAYVLIELYMMKNNPVVKIFYQDYNSREPQLVKVPTCGSFCTLVEFQDFVSRFIPNGDVCT